MRTTLALNCVAVLLLMSAGCEPGTAGFAEECVRDGTHELFARLAWSGGTNPAVSASEFGGTLTFTDPAHASISLDTGHADTCTTEYSQNRDPACSFQVTCEPCGADGTCMKLHIFALFDVGDPVIRGKAWLGPVANDGRRDGADYLLSFSPAK